MCWSAQLGNNNSLWHLLGLICLYRTLYPHVSAHSGTLKCIRFWIQLIACQSCCGLFPRVLSYWYHFYTVSSTIDLTNPIVGYSIIPPTRETSAISASEHHRGQVRASYIGSLLNTHMYTRTRMQDLSDQLLVTWQTVFYRIDQNRSMPANMHSLQTVNDLLTEWLFLSRGLIKGHQQTRNYGNGNNTTELQPLVIENTKKNLPSMNSVAPRTLGNNYKSWPHNFYFINPPCYNNGISLWTPSGLHTWISSVEFLQLLTLHHRALVWDPASQHKRRER